MDPSDYPTSGDWNPYNRLIRHAMTSRGSWEDYRDMMNRRVVFQDDNQGSFTRRRVVLQDPDHQTPFSSITAYVVRSDGSKVYLEVEPMEVEPAETNNVSPRKKSL